MNIATAHKKSINHRHSVFPSILLFICTGTLANIRMMTLIIFLLSVVLQTILMYVTLTPATVALALSSETDKLALLALKEKLTNGSPDHLPSWNESLHFCEWEGVTCGRRHRRVTVLHLENQNWGVSGTLGPALGNLTFLRMLNLSSINLHDEIPRQVGLLKRLQVLDLSKNNLHGEVPMELTNCTNLQVIDLSYNQLTGKVSPLFGSLMQLAELLLGTNNLVGTIPPSLANISSLQTISLETNKLEGSIPHALGKLSNLNTLVLCENKLSGVVPHSLYNLSNIQEFNIGVNQLLGTLPSNMDLVFPNLNVFLVGKNHFTGTFPSSISNLTELQALEISHNGFIGPIPPTLGSLKQLQLFHVGYNSFGSGRSHDLDFLSSLTNCTQLQIIILDDNRFGGSLPDDIGNFSIQLRLLQMNSNQISGVIPERIGQLIGLFEFDMMENFLEGTIPDSVGKLKRLGRLVFQENKLSGNIPIAIGNLTMLSDIYVGGNEFEGSIPFTLKHCTHLQTFSASSNKLSGDIPNQTFGYLQGLVNLDLSKNSLTGPLPPEFGTLKHLSILYLHTNKLSGEIPNELAACLTLTELYLEKNVFHGSIPSFLGSLRSLEKLNLVYNNFSGTIPLELENLTFLNILGLSYNHLYGEVPIGGVFSNATAIFLTGNKGLCGGIPQLKLPACSRVPSKKHKRSLTKKLILISVIGGVLISFTAFISIYFLKRKPKELPSSPSLQNRHLRVTYGELHESTNGFSLSNLVGMGSFGSVYKGSLLHFEGLIAVKVLNLEARGAAKSFTAECEALGRMKHRNLLRILTCCSSIDYKGEDFKAIVFEFMSNGSLENLLHGNEQCESGNLDLNLTQRVDIALDVAHALDYLHHDSVQAVIHCDVKPSNVLLDDDFVAHLGDFGLAKLIHGASGNSSKDQVSSSVVKGTIGYVPPEYGAGGAISPQGDIYSYGILLLEMLTRKRPTDSMFGESLSLHKFSKMAIPEGIVEIVDSHLLQPFVEDRRTGIVENNIRECLVSFARIGVACSEESPANRMHIKDVIVKLHEIKQKMPY